MKRKLMSLVSVFDGLILVFGTFSSALACHASEVHVTVVACVPGSNGQEVTISGLFNGGEGYRGTVKVDGNVIYGPQEYQGGNEDHHYSVTHNYDVGSYSVVALLEVFSNGSWVTADTKTASFNVVACPLPDELLHNRLRKTPVTPTDTKHACHSNRYAGHTHRHKHRLSLQPIHQ